MSRSLRSLKGVMSEIIYGSTIKVSTGLQTIAYIPFGILGLEFRNIMPEMENHMEKIMENHTETGKIFGFTLRLHVPKQLGTWASGTSRCSSALGEVFDYWGIWTFRVSRRAEVMSH